MMSLGAIIDLNEEIARKARKEKLQPCVVTQYDIDEAKAGRFTFSIPNLGYYKPKGWAKVKDYFVDKTGLGSDGEPALTFDKFIKQLVPGRAYGIIEEGEMQLYVGEFVKK